MRVRGVGDLPNEFCLIGPYPGPPENDTGIPFSPGKRYSDGSHRHTAGDELNSYLDGSTLPARDDIYITNLHKEYRGKDYVYSQEDVEAALPELQDEVRECEPKVIIAMGREVARLFLGDVDISDVEGIPWLLPLDRDAEVGERWGFLPPSTVVFPMVHVAAGMRNSNLSPYVVRGFKELSEFLEGNVVPRKLFDDPYPNPTYIEITSETQLKAILACITASSRVAIDTEGWPAKPWSIQFSLTPGWGYLIRADRHDLLKPFFDRLHAVRPRLVFHPYMHEAPMGRALGYTFDGLDYDDTRVMAYLLQIEPQGLKAACLRHCNMRMMEYTEVIGDVANEKAIEYLTWLWDVEQFEYEERCHAEFVRLTTTPYVDGRGKLQPGRRLKVDPKLPKTALHKAVERVMRSKEPARLWHDQVIDIQDAGYRRLGPMPDATLDYVDPSISVPYGCRDADATGRLLPEYERRLDAMGLRGVYRLELGANPILDRMQQIGILPDLNHFAELSAVLAVRLDQLREDLATATGRADFNANSGDQVADFLFGTLGLDEIKMTSGGRGSTNDKILEALEHEHPEHPVISDIREYREVYKLKNTFVDRLPDYVARWPWDGRVHTTLRSTSVVTGRLAAADPNMLAQPEHGDFATDFKRGWVPGEGTAHDPHHPHVVCAWDESQIELRGLAHLSQDPVMCAVFRGEKRNPDGSLIDLHAALAERIFGVKPKNQDKHKHRLPAKAVNFGLPMGMTCKGLSVELRKNGLQVTEDDAQRWIDDTFAMYKGVAAFKQARVAEVRRNGYVRCVSGRIRYIGGIRSRDDRIREEAERFAFSTPIQESATFIMKQAEATVYQDIFVPYWRQGRWVEPLLQVHDCLKMECEEGIEQELNGMMVAAMTNVPKGFSVPLAVEGEWSRFNFADVEHF